MILEQRLELKMQLKLVLTPQLQQAIKLLQLPQLELRQMLTQELVENPFLEEMLEESSNDEHADERMNDMEPTPAPADEAELPLEQLLRFSVDEYFDSRSYDGKDLGYFGPDSEPSQSLEQYVSQTNDLSDDLNWQLRMSDAADDVRQAAEEVIGNIDDNGYLQSSVEEIAQACASSLEITEQAISRVQSFDPPGIGARDLQECLLLQLKPLDLNGSLVESLITNNIRDIEKKRYKQMSIQYSCTLEDITAAIKVIEGLEPRPGRGLSESQPIYIKPDVYIIRDNNEFRIVLSDDNMPNVKINNFYKQLLMKKNTLEKKEKEYLTERLRSAVWLLKSLDHRNKTIYRVTKSILEFQREFFEHGITFMKPLNLKDVAQDLDMHESTISRATSNKYLSCSHGLLNFRYFFSSGIKSSTGTISSMIVKDMIKKIISEENGKKPFSDQKIVNTLKERNITVARRTIAKYREEMHIPSQSLRKRHDL